MNPDLSARRTYPALRGLLFPQSWPIFRGVWDNLGRNHGSMMAAGIAFYALLSIFPGFSAVISIYGLIADPTAIQSQVAVLSVVVPAEVLKLLSDRLSFVAINSPSTLGIGLLVSVAVGLWSAMSATSKLMQALTIAFNGKERRSLVVFYLTALVLTVTLIVFGLLSLALVAALPAVLEHLPFSSFPSRTLSLARWPMLAALSMAALAILYRFAPSGDDQQWRWISPGAVAATILWMLSSVAFSIYVSRFASYDTTYGSIGAVVILMMWLYLTAYSLLAGAELDTAIERQTTRPSDGKGQVPYDNLDPAQP